MAILIPMRGGHLRFQAICNRDVFDWWETRILSTTDLNWRIKRNVMIKAFLSNICSCYYWTCIRIDISCGILAQIDTLTSIDMTAAGMPPSDIFMKPCIFSLGGYPACLVLSDQGSVTRMLDHQTPPDTPV